MWKTIVVTAFCLTVLLPAAVADEAKPPTPKEILAAVEDYGEKHPDDFAGLRDRYLDARDLLPADSYEHAVATKRIADLDKVVGEVYRTIRPAEGAAAPFDRATRTRLALALLRDLRSREPAVRRVAADYLGRLGSEVGVPALVTRLGRDEDAGVKKAAARAITAIGGPKAAALIAERLADRSVADQAAALTVLEALLAESDEAEDEAASRAIGEFVFSRDPGIAERSIRILAAAGDRGVPGLTRATEIADHQLKLQVIRALGDTGSGRAASVCARFLDRHRRGGQSLEKEYSAVAMGSIVAIGRPAVPWLGSYLNDSRRRQKVRYCLREITGRSFARPDEVAAWWSPHERRKAAK